jgi:Short C-terminal domain
VAFDGLKNLFNAKIKDGVRGRAIVQSASVPSREATSYNVKMWLDVYVDGWDPYRTEHECMVKSGKHPHLGTTLPVTVDPENRDRMRIEWDEVQSVDERMAAGEPGEFPGAVNVRTIDVSAGDEVPPEVQQMLAAGGIDLSALAGPQAQQGQQQPDSGDEIADQLELVKKLGELRDAGLLTQDEFEAKKAEILRGDD